MVDVLTKQQRSYNMSQIKSKNTKIEIKLRDYLKNRGLSHFTTNLKIYGKPDIAFENEKVAVFVDGCFWHKCPKCFKKPDSNEKMWDDKISKNVKHDKEVNKKLKEQGWTVVRLWEHDIKKNIDSSFLKIKSEVDRFNAIDLFSGAGGLSYGLEKAGFRILLGIDHNEDAVESYNKNHKCATGLVEDMTQLSVSRIRKLTGNRKIHLVAGGPPCQGFSMAGKRTPNDPRNSLFKEFIRIVKGIKPDLCIMENVRGLLSMKTPEEEKVIDVILDEFKNIKYDAKVYSVNTADYEVPQKRHRIFIVAKKKRVKFKFPLQTHSKTGIDKEGNKLKKWVSIKKIIIPKNEVDAKYFYSDKLIKGFIRREKQNHQRGMGFGWKFLDENNPSYTLSARYYKDGAEALIKYSEKEIRMLTPIECAQIQSFPKTFKFAGNKNSVYRQIGNAVPPLMAKKIGFELINALEIKYYV